MAAEDYIDMSHMHSDDVPAAAFGPYGVRLATDKSGNAVLEPRNHGKPWSDSMDARLLSNWRTHHTVQEIAFRMGRTDGSIASRLRWLGVPCDDMGKPLMYDGTNCPMRNAPKSTLPATKSKEDIMNVKMTHLITLLQKGFTTVEVQFNKSDAKTYTYKAPEAMGLVEDDRVVVEANGRMEVARVTAVHPEPQVDFDQPYALKWVVQRVDTTAYEDQKVREAAAMSMIHKANQVKRQQEALDSLLGTGTSREELLKLLNGG